MIIEIILAIETVAFIVEGYVIWNLMKKVELLETYVIDRGEPEGNEAVENEKWYDRVFTPKELKGKK